mmetsp:Transcript_68076/g.215376  ORF Transcript_68076/g.215376 Transcript_68076/m.215376 type:complete len:265 (+) Transcript_68076:636-1430(+)
MDVRLRVLGGLALHDELYVRDVQPARGHVRRHEHGELARAKASQRLLADRLRDVPVQRPRPDGVPDLRGQLVAVVLGLGEDNSAPVVHVGAHDVLHDLGPLRPVAGEGHVPHARAGFHHGSPHKVHHAAVILEEALGDVRHPRRHRGGEQQGLHLSLVHPGPQDLLHIVHKAHVEHLVGLVQDAELEGTQVEAAALEVVLDTAWSADDDVHPPAQRVLLPRVGGTTVDTRGCQAQRIPHVIEVHCDLLGELTRRGEHDDARGPA